HPRSRRLTDDHKSRRWSAAQHGTGPERQVGRADGAGSDFSCETVESFAHWRDRCRGTAVSFGKRGVSGEHEIIALSVARISAIIDERSQDSKAEAADPRLCHWFTEIRQGLCQGVEWPTVITEFDLKPPGLEGEVDLDPALSVVVVAMVHGIGEQLL